MKQKNWVLFLTLPIFLAAGFFILVHQASANATASPGTTPTIVSADSASSTASEAALTIVITEGAASDIGNTAPTTTLVFAPPTGFTFDTSTTSPNLAVTGTGLAVAGSTATMTASTLTVVVSATSSVAGTLTIGGGSSKIYIKATVGNPFASNGNITVSSGLIKGVTNSVTAIAALTEQAGAGTQLTWVGNQPSATVVAGATIGGSPKVTVQDQFGNTATSSSASITVTAVLSSDGTTAGGGTLGGTVTRSAAVGITAAFSDLTYTKAEAIKLHAASSGLTAANSSAITVSVGTITKLGFTVQPSSSVGANTIFPAVTVAAQDANGNATTTESGRTITVSAVSVTDGTVAASYTLGGTLSGTESSGSVTFSDLTYSYRDSIMLKATASGLTAGFSTGINVNSGSTSQSSSQAPSSAITSPVSGSTVVFGSSAAISGTATPGSSSNIQKVEVSVDGGLTWADAAGSSIWTYAWTAPLSAQTVTIKSRATDWSGKVETPGAGVTVTIGAAAYTPPAATTTPTTTPPATTPPATTPPTVPVVAPLPWPNGSLVKTGSSGTVYLVADSMLKPFTSAALFHARGLKFSDIQTITADQFAAAVVGSPVLYPDGALIKGSGPTVYVVMSGQKNGIVSMAVFKRLGLLLKNIVKISDGDLAIYPLGPLQQ